VGLGWQQAAARAIGEVLERYAACQLDPARLRVASWKEVSGPGPECYQLFSAAQWSAGLPYVRFTEDTVLEWVQGWDLATGDPVSVPAKRVCLASPCGRWLADIGPTTSTGLACGRNRDAVLLAGLLEVIERDAFALTWWRRLPTVPIHLPAYGPLGRLARDRFNRSGLSFVFRLLPTDTGVPVVLALVLDPDAERSVAAVGAAAHLDPAAALLKAWLEAVQTRAWLRQMGGGAGYDPGPAFENVRRFSDHVRLFGQPQSLPHLDFLVETPRSPVDLEELIEQSDTQGADLAHCLGRLARCGLRAVAVELTPPELAVCGFVAVKVLVPGMVDIAASHAHPFLGSRRLWETPARLGFDPGHEPNPYPHPFP
jgi:ribosomal protein S12 methylthiotransferase accessory factor